MTKKEKAKELVDKFTFYCYECDGYSNAKESALTCVDEIIDAESNMFSEHYINASKEDYFKKSHRYAYWLLVKQEIQKL